LQPQENITNAQVSNLLSIFIPAFNFMLANPEVEQTHGGKNDGGARAAVETTLINICNRFDAIIADEPRWTLTNHGSLEDSFKQVYQQHARMLSEQANAYAEINTPHARLKPSLLKLPDGSWVAFLGDLNDINNAVVGTGTCPANAVAAFDAMYSGEVPKELQEWLAARGVDLNKPTEQKTNEQIKTVDGTGLERPESPPGKRKVKPRNRKGLGPDGQVGGKEDLL
jgi:hypothetical protein